MFCFFFFLFFLQFNIFSAEHNVYEDERYQQVTDPTIRLASESMGGFLDAMKQFIVYTAAQNVPGTKEAGTGYYYDNNTKKMKRTLFFRVGKGYPRVTHKPLDFKIDGKGFFVIELPGGWQAFTHDGRFEIDSNKRLVTLSNGFPVLGENGYIYLQDEDVSVTKEGIIYHQGELIDKFKVQWVSNKKDLNSFNQSIFYLDRHKYFEPGYLAEPKFEILQGYVEDSTITKAYIGLVPEWQNGHEANVRLIKSYVRNMSSAVQLANP